MAIPQVYNDLTHFNEQNVTVYLAELEEYIAQLITYLAHKNKDDNAAFASVPLDVLEIKDFDKKLLSIKAPIASDKVDASTEDGDDDCITDAKDLYKKFV